MCIRDRCKISPKTKLAELYSDQTIQERHRHRWEFNNSYRKQYEDKGMVFSGICPENNLVEVLELPDHPYYLACQYHPEFKSRPTQAHPLFKGFVAATKAFSGIQQSLFIA